MGEVPVLDHGGRKLSQSAVCLTYLAERSGKFRPEGEDERARMPALAHLRQPEGQRLSRAVPVPARTSRRRPIPAARRSCKGRLDGNRSPIVDKRLAKAPFLLGPRPTIADVSLAGYFYYPPEEFGFDIAKDHPHIGAWMERIKALPGWKHPYELMPGYPLKRA